MATATLAFSIDTEVTEAYLDDLLKFLRQYLLSHPERFINVKWSTTDHVHVLNFASLEPEGRGHVDVRMEAVKPIRVEMTPSDENVPQAALDQLKEDLILVVQYFEEDVRKTTLYFSWVEGREILPEKVPSRRGTILDRLFSETMILLFIVFIAASILMYWVLGFYTPIALVVIQLVMVLFSDRIVMKMGQWSITPENPSVHLLQYHLPVEEYREFQQKYGENLVMKMKKEIYEKTLAVGRELDCQTAEEVLTQYGIKCLPENMSTKKVNVYQLVKRVAGRFNLPIPKITVSNSMLPNAAASGPSPSHGTLLITTGLLVQLEEDEIFSVLGHEFSHLKGRDSLALFALTVSEYLLRVYVLGPIVMFLPYIYFVVAMGVVYFIAKFFEARADLESAIRIGQPKVLAEALRKIGFRKLQFERVPSYRIQSWIGWDPHPPTYFRISRLEGLQTPVEVKHPLLRSAKDVINGFLATF